VNIYYKTEKSEDVRIRVYNRNGRCINKLVERSVTPGSYAEVWKGDDDKGETAKAGIYLIYIKTGEDTYREKVAIIR